ncbi:MAG: hypothetical protein CME31_07690 [Gimesia sp.]|uniref:Uncharacterized protein n=1 Tax=Gimesia maris TaxID=122 RepID=A0A3D3RFH7_9PLAN|nr:hypothetical protein [Gimesia sp.]HCO27583.1 hypothetical protein [Gimesia maris]
MIKFSCVIFTECFETVLQDHRSFNITVCELEGVFRTDMSHRVPFDTELTVPGAVLNSRQQNATHYSHQKYIYLKFSDMLFSSCQLLFISTGETNNRYVMKIIHETETGLPILFLT